MSNSPQTRRLLSWYDDNKRALPWRESADPYRVWVSEIMLQQTRVEAVLGYYTAFLERFPTVEALAEAPLESLYKAWEGLGYYSRAKRLRDAAAIVAREGFPISREGWLALPGVGPYTSAAIASICLGEPVCAVDGNVLRVMARYAGIRQPIESPGAKRAAEEAAGVLMDAGRPGDSNQALMELGATICLPRSPRCLDCPLRGACDAFARGDARTLPIRAPKKGKVTERLALCIILCGDRVLIRKRPEEGLLGGQWEFPSALDAGFLSRLGATQVSALAPVKHVFTHRVWEMEGILYHAQSSGGLAPPYRWVDRAELLAIPVPSAMAPWRAVALEALP